MAPEIDKQAILDKIVEILQGDETVVGLVPKNNIGSNATQYATIAPNISVIDGGDELVTEIRRRTVITILIRTSRPDINSSDKLCSRIEDAVTNVLGRTENLTLGGEVSRFIEISSEALVVEDDPTIRMHAITAKYEVV